MKVIGKKVELTELFYDLVFVYAVSQATGLLKELPVGVTFWTQLLVFTIVMIVFVNTWMIETVFTNRYGKNSIMNILFFMVDMGILLFMSANFVGTIQQWFMPVTFAAGLLSLTLVLQYLSVFLTTRNETDKKLSRLFIFIVSLRTILLLVASFLPIQIGIVVAILGVVISWIMPGIFTPLMRNRPINFPHLLERLTALIIIVFGESIVEVAEYFSLEKISLISILIFAIVCALFMTYITQFDHFIEENQVNETGNRLIYLHYPILFGVILITVSLSFLSEKELPLNFSTTTLYLGIAMFYVGIFLADYYNKEQLNKSRIVTSTFFITTIVGFLISLFLKQYSYIVIMTSIVTIINSFSLSWSMVRQTRPQI